MSACQESPPPLLLAGIAQFNGGEYFEQHETLELLWRAERRDVRRLYQGILQIGVAFHHLRRANHHGTVYMLRRGAQRGRCRVGARPVVRGSGGWGGGGGWAAGGGGGVGGGAPAWL